MSWFSSLFESDCDELVDIFCCNSGLGPLSNYGVGTGEKSMLANTVAGNNLCFLLNSVSIYNLILEMTF